MFGRLLILLVALFFLSKWLGVGLALPKIPAHSIPSDHLVQERTLAPVHKSDYCVLGKLMPDRGCTPGAVMDPPPAVCHHHNPTEDLDFYTVSWIYAIYKIDYENWDKYEIAHVVPISLGGTNTQANLYPILKSSLGARQKAQAGHYLWHQHCQKGMPLVEAQKQIAIDWTDVWDHLPLLYLTGKKALGTNEGFYNWF